MLIFINAKTLFLSVLLQLLAMFMYVIEWSIVI